MKAVIGTLIILLVASLGTSGYLLMEKSKSEKIINDALQDAGLQKKKLLQAISQKAGAEKDGLEYQSLLNQATNNLEIVKDQLEKIKETTALKSSEDARIISESQRKQSELSAELLKQKKQLDATLSKHETINTSLQKDLTDAKKIYIESSKELGKTVEALKPFLATGLTPEQISELSRKRPVEITAPHFIRPKPIRPRKIHIPIKPETP